VAEAIGNGIRGPAQKIGQMASQARQFAEGLLARIRPAGGAGNRPTG
jgi:hypothetical protein